MIVSITFMGLCAFVRHTSSSRLKVVLPDVTHHDNHQAVLLFRKGVVKSASPRQPDFSFLAPKETIPPGPGGSRVDVDAILLEGEDLEFFPPAPQQALGVPGTVSGCPSITNSASFDWIAKMATVGAGKMADVILGTSPPGVLARFLVLGSDLATTSFRGSVNTNDIGLWQFKKQDGTVAGNPRAFAESSMITFSIPTPTTNWGIKVTSFSGGGQNIIVNTASDLEIWVANSPLLNLLTGRGVIPSVETHFDHYYQFASSNTGFLPHFHSVCQSAGGLNGPKCPTVQFDNNSLV